MKRRDFLISLAAAGVFPAASACAQTAQDQIVNQLKSQGYRDFRISRTWLGRVRILATGPDGRREVVLNPASGAVLRDYLDRDRGASQGRSADEDNSGRGGDRSDDDNSGSGKDDDDNSGSGKDDDDDNSGSGKDDDGDSDDGKGDSDNSGSGGGGDDD